MKRFMNFNFFFLINYFILVFSEYFGFDSFKRQNLSLLDEENMIFSSGVVYCI
jgi:predicted negative regulator of RcsB-dependent stress response